MSGIPFPRASDSFGLRGADRKRCAARAEVPSPAHPFLLETVTGTVVGVKRAGRDLIYAQPDTFVEPGDELFVAGATRKIETFCALTSQRS